jgi:hypothetical protein
MTDTELAAVADSPSEPELMRPTDTGSAAAPSSAERPAFVYALGRIESRFPSLGVEKDFAQVLARTDSAGRTERQAMRAATSDRDNPYLARSLCWVFMVEAMETYILVPPDLADLDLLVDSYREEARRDDVDVVGGVRGPVAAPDVCNGLTVPIVVFDQIYSFDRDYLVESISPAGLAHQGPRRAVPVDGRWAARSAHAAGRQCRSARRAAGVELPAPALSADVRDSCGAVRSQLRLPGGRGAAVPIERRALGGRCGLSFRHRESDVLEQRYVRVDPVASTTGGMSWG